ncbi:MAG: hypothetical protein F4W94_00820 [Acidimicrobiia bacterium]|nr:hypothetical protein [Acidimicrobiia bacterium]MYD40268.1 hypothetical protein [Acidimicrobiia bacterium]MYK54922.1 hypothetical protein [Acidimicrobiia bacterium]
MEEMLQLWLPLAALAVSASIALVARILERRRPRRRLMKGLDPGVSLFTSERCPGCDPVRSRLIEVLGPEGFREIKWTEHPDLFVTHMVDRVPTTAAVNASGDALIWEGMPPVRLLQRWRSFVNLH